MKVKWDYTLLADSYLKRAEYSSRAIDRMLEDTGISETAKVCDIGAGTGNLTIPLLERNFNVVAVEPNDAMRKNGKIRSSPYYDIVWVEGTGEHTGLPDDTFELVTFGSSFNVVDRNAALIEACRIAKNKGWLACMWNHRFIEDPIQARIESIIKDILPAYDYGLRREDQTEILQVSGLLGEISKIEEAIVFTQEIEECVTAWRSHGTLHRQAGDKFGEIIDRIKQYLYSLNQVTIEVPYTTRIWIAQVKS